MNDKNKATLSFILSLVSFPLAFAPCISIFTIPCAIIALIFGILSRRETLGKAGIIISILAIIFYICIMVGFVALSMLNNNGR